MRFRPYRFDLRRAAQYFFILTPTALRCAAVIFRLGRREPVAAALRAPILKMKFNGNSSSSTEALRSGNTVRSCLPPQPTRGDVLPRHDERKTSDRMLWPNDRLQKSLDYSLFFSLPN